MLRLRSFGHSSTVDGVLGCNREGARANNYKQSKTHASSSENTPAVRCRFVGKNGDKDKSRVVTQICTRRWGRPPFHPTQTSATRFYTAPPPEGKLATDTLTPFPAPPPVVCEISGPMGGGILHTTGAEAEILQ